MKILLIEDDTTLVSHLSESLKEQGFITTVATSSQELAEILESPFWPDLILMDRLLRSFDTKEFFPRLRQKWPSVPAIILSAISTPNERTDMLNLGADDYLGKPFSTQELMARIRVQLRRNSSSQSGFLQVGNLIVDSMKRVVSVGEKSEALPAREFAVVRTLAQDPTRIWNKEELLDYVWGQTSSVETNVVESTIANVRRKLEVLGADVSIRNMRNAGYWIAK